MAEKELRYYFVLDLLASHIGDEYEGTVTGVTGNGIYVQLDRFLVDGLVRLSDLPSRGQTERWRMNRTTGSLIEQRTGKTISVGDRFTVRVVNASPEQRKLDLYVVDEMGTEKFSDRRKRKQTQKNKLRGPGKRSKNKGRKRR